jgi:sugar transferase (PEP-CTERM system associated)
MLELFRSPRRAIVWFVEASLLSLSALLAAGVTLGWARALGEGHVLRALLITAVVQGSMYYHGLYAPRPLRPQALALGLGRALLVAGAALAILFAILPWAAFGRGVFVASLGGAAVILPAWRAVYARVAESASFRTTAIILGDGPLACECAALIEGRAVTGMALAGILVHEGEQGYGDLRRVVEDRGVSRIIVASRERRGTLPVGELLELKLRGVAIEEAIEFYEAATGKVFVPGLKPGDLVFSRGYCVRRTSLRIKRALDVALAALGLCLALPLLVLAAIAVKLDSRGPVLYAQERAGAFGKAFRIHKLRSMRTDAEAAGAVWAAEGDPRVTRVGRLLRQTRIDEIPQLWNVLIGEMSLVGPRPERPVFLEQLERKIPFFRQRLCMKPGITGHAQVRARYGASVEDALEKLEYDLFYIKTFSLWFDLSILIDTVKVVLLRVGSR